MFSVALSHSSDVSSAGRMSQWNCDALASLKGELKLNVSMNTGLTDKLEKVQGGFMSRCEAQMINGLPNKHEQIDRVIEILRKKTDKDFDTFCTMLRETNHVAWAVELEKETERFKKGGGKGTYMQGRDCSAIFIVLRIPLCILCHFLLMAICA